MFYLFSRDQNIFFSSWFLSFSAYSNIRARAVAETGEEGAEYSGILVPRHGSSIYQGVVVGLLFSVDYLIIHCRRSDILAYHKLRSVHAL